jgi:hypothetical protein
MNSIEYSFLMSKTFIEEFDNKLNTLFYNDGSLKALSVTWLIFHCCFVIFSYSVGLFSVSISSLNIFLGVALLSLVPIFLILKREKKSVVISMFLFIVFWSIFLYISPIAGFDDFSYRLPALGYFFQNNGFVPVDSYKWWMNVYPKGAESWYVSIFLLTKSENYLNFIHLPFLTTFSCFLFKILRFKFNSNLSFFISIFLIFISPVIFLQTQTVYNDLLLGFFFFMGLYFLMRFKLNAKGSDLAMSFAFILQMLLVKLSGWPVLGSFILLTGGAVYLLIQKKVKINLKLTCDSGFALLISGLTILIYIGHQKFYYGTFLPIIPKVASVDMPSSFVMKQMSYLGMWDSSGDLDWMHFYGHDFSKLNHFAKTLLVFLELKGWSGFRYFYDARFSGYGIYALLAILILVFDIVKTKLYKEKYFFKTSFIFYFLAVIVFTYLLSPYKYYPRYVPAMWLLVTFSTIYCLFRFVGRKSSKVLAGVFIVLVAFTSFHVSQTFFSFSTDKKIDYMKRSLVLEVLEREKPKVVCMDKSFPFIYLGWMRNFSNKVIETELNEMCDMYFTGKSDDIANYSRIYEFRPHLYIYKAIKKY